jgi:hypothetical protein
MTNSRLAKESKWMTKSRSATVSDAPLKRQNGLCKNHIGSIKKYRYRHVAPGTGIYKDYIHLILLGFRDMPVRLLFIPSPAILLSRYRPDISRLPRVTTLYTVRFSIATESRRGQEKLMPFYDLKKFFLRGSQG